MCELQAQGILDSFYEVFQHTSTPVLLIGAFEALSRADTHHYVELGTIEALRDALVLEKNAVINTDMGLLYFYFYYCYYVISNSTLLRFYLYYY